jgi:diguanylate cyclase (GGDEF)-like protein
VAGGPEKTGQTWPVIAGICFIAECTHAAARAENLNFLPLLQAVAQTPAGASPPFYLHPVFFYGLITALIAAWALSLWGWRRRCEDQYRARLEPLRRSESELRQAYEQLEFEVNTRTSELQTANEKLWRTSAARAKALERLQKMNQLNEALLKPGGLTEKLKAITDSLVEMFAIDFCRIWLIQPGDLCNHGCTHAQYAKGPHACRDRSRCLRLMVSSGTVSSTESSTHKRVPIGCYKIGRVGAGELRKFMTNDIRRDRRVINPEALAEMGLVSFAGYQLADSQSAPLGVLAFLGKKPISEEEDAMLESMANSISVAVQTAKAEEELRRLSQQDGLTGIANRRIFDAALAQEWRRGLRSKGPLSVILLDIDFFKRFNDTYGHQAGDDCLIRAAHALRTTLKRPGDFIGRYGGEEFVAILPESDLDGAVCVAENMRQCVEALAIPHARSEAAYYVTVSLGVACMIPGPEANETRLVEMADQALYQAKEAGRNRFQAAVPPAAETPGREQDA